MLCCLTLSHPQKDALDYAKTVEGIRDGRSAEEWRPSLIASTRWGGEPIALITTDWHASFRPDVWPTIASSEPKRRRAWGISRISSEVQLEEGESLAQQQRAIELICELENFELMHVFADAAVSGLCRLLSGLEGPSYLPASRRTTLWSASNRIECFAQRLTHLSRRRS